ncbi:MAG: HAD-IIB family hydrolase [Bacteriovoracaceae bacterium]|nr:HAD-IIB family hydrolase [Bacteriovoracaceae bacterium]
MRPWQEFAEHDLARVKGICFDLDGTFTTRGKVTSKAYQVLWDLHRAGLQLIPITGRAAGHGDILLRFWPIDAVIVESGALVYYWAHGQKQIFLGDQDAWPASRLRQEFLPLLQKNFSQAQVALDQDFRQYDLAIDIGEEVPPWDATQIASAIDFCQAHGHAASASSVHINIWHGAISKPAAFQKWQKFLGHPIDLDQWLYIGDAANDAAAFAYFKHTVAVANFKKYQNQVATLPQWITAQEMGDGFIEVGSRLLAGRNAS